MLQNNTKICSLKYTSLYLVVRTDKLGSQGHAGSPIPWAKGLCCWPFGWL